jgi:hypothetical protein
LNRLRREYGWVVDYEESPQSPANLIRRPDGRVSPKIRTLEAQLTKPKTGASTEEWATLTELAKAFNQADREDHKLVKNGDADRFDLVPTGKGVTPILDTIVTLKPINRTAGESIDALLQAVQAATQQRIEVGGLASPGLTNTYVTVGGTHPARVFLAEILDSLSSRKVWLVTYDPEAAHYVISIETAVRAALTSSGKTLVTPIRPDRR